MTVAQAQEEVSSSEFVEWMCFFEIEHENTDKLEYYFAQLTAQNTRLQMDSASAARKIKDKDFILNFKRKQKKQKVVTEDMDPEARMKASKSVWCAFVGIK